MKDFLKITFLFTLFLIIYIYRFQIRDFVMDKFIYKDGYYEFNEGEYTIKYDFNYIDTTDSVYVENKEQILNAFYTLLNNGQSEFYFYCRYDGCEDDIHKYSKSNVFSNINNFVSPYNTYNRIFIYTNSWGKVTIKVEKAYQNSEISVIESKIDEIIKNNIKDTMTDKEKITTFHNYIINHTKYDTDYKESDESAIYSASSRASGPLLYGKALCGGYAHVMSIFLNKLNIPNYRVSSDIHIWNLVKLDNTWYHLDLTWDDPVTSNNKDVLLDKYLLISTKKLESYNTGYHDFDKAIYLEANQVQ